MHTKGLTRKYQSKYKNTALLGGVCLGITSLTLLIQQDVLIQIFAYQLRYGHHNTYYRDT